MVLVSLHGLNVLRLSEILTSSANLQYFFRYCDATQIEPEPTVLRQQMDENTSSPGALHVTSGVSVSGCENTSGPQCVSFRLM